MFFCIINWVQRVQYAKTKSDCVAKADGTFVPREKKKKQEEKGEPKLFCPFPYYSSYMIRQLSFSFPNYCWHLIAKKELWTSI